MGIAHSSWHVVGTQCISWTDHISLTSRDSAQSATYGNGEDVVAINSHDQELSVIAEGYVENSDRAGVYSETCAAHKPKTVCLTRV